MHDAEWAEITRAATLAGLPRVTWARTVLLAVANDPAIRVRLGMDIVGNGVGNGVGVGTRGL